MKRFSVFAIIAIVAGAVYTLFPGDSVTTTANKEASAGEHSGALAYTYKIKNGDSLILIARKFGLDVETIKDANTLKDSVIYKGDLLGIPVDPSSVAFFYTAKPGDTITSIARAHGTSVERVMRLNHMDDDSLIASQKILVNRNPDSDARYVVFEIADGDTPQEISKAFGVGIKEIEKMNASHPGWKDPGSHIVVDTFDYKYSPRTRDSIIDTAKRYLGSPYKYGGNSTKTGIDCSAYVKKVFGFFGVNLPRTVRLMHKHADGLWVDKNRLMKGDLVFFETDRPFPSHIGIYMGDGKFIHASSVGEKVIVSELSRPYYTETYIGAKRIYLRDSDTVAYLDTETEH